MISHAIADLVRNLLVDRYPAFEMWTSTAEAAVAAMATVFSLFNHSPEVAGLFAFYSAFTIFLLAESERKRIGSSWAPPIWARMSAYALFGGFSLLALAFVVSPSIGWGERFVALAIVPFGFLLIRRVTKGGWVVKGDAPKETAP